MNKIVTVLEAETQLSDLLEAVESGAESEIVIARDGKPVARLVPPVNQEKPRYLLGLHEGEFPDFDLEEFNARDEEIARMITDGPLFPDEPDNNDFEHGEEKLKSPP